ncbi:MAG: transcription termination/antitermination protein NusA, partial [Dehalococcoidia bacterium]|nr:transcription termination/antitermination protein NusA [Dehalococcoidia bacterium]
VHVRISGETGDISAFIQKTVVRKVEDTNLEMDLEEARRYKADARIDDILEFEVKPPENAGRIAAQTAKQVVLQRLREAERGAIYEEYADKQGEVLLATVQRVENRQATVEIGRGTEALLPGSEMVRNEHLRAGQRVKVLLLEVNDEVKGPQVIVSRGHRLLLRRLLEVEVPEIAQGRVEVKAIAREGGHRSKVAVHGRAASVDPIGACVGMRGSRIQNVVNELGGERVDIIKWDPDPVEFVTNALSPAQIVEVRLDDESREAVIIVPDSMLSLAIGKEGQNARLAAKLSGYRISIRSQSGAERDDEGAAIVEAPAAFDAFPPGTEPDLDILQLPDEPLPPIEIEVPRPAAAVSVPAAAAVASEEPAALGEASQEEDVLFPAALAEMEVPDEETREAEDYGEEEFDEDEGEEYQVPTLVVPEERPTAIRFAEDVLPAREEEDQPKRRRRRGPRVEEDDLEDDIDYSGRIH